MSILSPTVVPNEEDLKTAVGKAVDPDALVKHLWMLVYGKPKRGKTRFVGTFPKPLILDFDHGSGVLAGSKFDGKVVPVSEWDEVALWYYFLRHRKHPFQTVVWDTISMAQDLALREVIAERTAKRQDADPYKATQDDFGRAGRILRTWIDLYLQLPMHVVFVAHEREDDAPDEEEGEGSVKWMVPDLQPMVRGYLAGRVHVIAYAYKVDKKDGDRTVKSFRLGFDRAGTVASDRFNRLPRVIKDPTFEKVWKYYTGGEEK